MGNIEYFNHFFNDPALNNQGGRIGRLMDCLGLEDDFTKNDILEILLVQEANKELKRDNLKICEKNRLEGLLFAIEDKHNAIEEKELARLERQARREAKVV